MLPGGEVHDVIYYDGRLFPGANGIGGVIGPGDSELSDVCGLNLVQRGYFEPPESRP